MSTNKPQVAPSVIKREIDGVSYVCIPAEMPVSILKVALDLVHQWEEDDITTLPADELAELLVRYRA